ncbi:MAG: radical SAM protein [Candidatus Levybacteria bacterium]|nr:radical SAM protein [Candidatus Levybacteria bacterium]
MKELLCAPDILRKYLDKNSHRYAVLETNTDCNRRCSYCTIPQTYKKEGELTLEETIGVVDSLHQQGFLLVSFLGGEPLAPFNTKEGITFAEHTLESVRHASSKGMITNVTTNGDYINRDIVRALKGAGLDSLNFSLHSFTEAGINHLIKSARIAAQAGIVPAIHALFTSANTDVLPSIASNIAENGILFSFNILHEKGMGFSAPRTGESNTPSLEQQKKVLAALLRLKSYGFVLNNRDYLTNTPNYHGNSWTCDPERDSFIHIGAGGFVNICSEVRTGFKTADVSLTSQEWREQKRILVQNCGNCLYKCYYEAQNTDLKGDIPMFLVMMLIKSGNAALAEKLGKFAVQRIRKS